MHITYSMVSPKIMFLECPCKRPFPPRLLISSLDEFLRKTGHLETVALLSLPDFRFTIIQNNVFRFPVEQYDTHSFFLVEQVMLEFVFFYTFPSFHCCMQVNRNIFFLLKFWGHLLPALQHPLPHTWLVPLRLTRDQLGWGFGAGGPPVIILRQVAFFLPQSAEPLRGIENRHRTVRGYDWCAAVIQPFPAVICMPCPSRAATPGSRCGHPGPPPRRVPRAAAPGGLQGPEPNRVVFEPQHRCQRVGPQGRPHPCSVCRPAPLPGHKAHPE